MFVNIQKMRFLAKRVNRKVKSSRKEKIGIFAEFFVKRRKKPAIGMRMPLLIQTGKKFVSTVLYDAVFCCGLPPGLLWRMILSFFSTFLKVLCMHQVCIN